MIQVTAEVHDYTFWYVFSGTVVKGAEQRIQVGGKTLAGEFCLLTLKFAKILTQPCMYNAPH